MIHDISVIIPIKDDTELDYLDRLLEQLCRQDMKYRLEIIVVTKNVKGAANITLKDKFEYVPPIHVFGDDWDKIQAMNIGATSANGDILVFLDVDNGLTPFKIGEMVRPIINQEYVMTYIPVKYDSDEGKTEKEKKLIKYNNFLLRFSLSPRPPFAISKEVFRQFPLKGKNPYIELSMCVLWKYPGSIKKIEDEVLVSPRHVLARARGKQHKPEV